MFSQPANNAISIHNYYASACGLACLLCDRWGCRSRVSCVCVYAPLTALTSLTKLVVISQPDHTISVLSCGASTGIMIVGSSSVTAITLMVFGFLFWWWKHCALEGVAFLINLSLGCEVIIRERRNNSNSNFLSTLISATSFTYKRTNSSSRRFLSTSGW